MSDEPPKKKFALGAVLLSLALILLVASVVMSYIGTKVAGDLHWGSLLRVAAALISVLWTITRIEDEMFKRK